MLITCPYCGPRDLSEYAYKGDGRRSARSGHWPGRAHLAVVRNTLTHHISSVGFAREAGHRKSERHRKSGSAA